MMDDADVVDGGNDDWDDDTSKRRGSRYRGQNVFKPKPLLRPIRAPRPKRPRGGRTFHGFGYEEWSQGSEAEWYGQQVARERHADESGQSPVDGDEQPVVPAGEWPAEREAGEYGRDAEAFGFDQPDESFFSSQSVEMDELGSGPQDDRQLELEFDGAAERAMRDTALDEFWGNQVSAAGMGEPQAPTDVAMPFAAELEPLRPGAGVDGVALPGLPETAPGAQPAAGVPQDPWRDPTWDDGFSSDTGGGSAWGGWEFDKPGDGW